MAGIMGAAIKNLKGWISGVSIYFVRILYIFRFIQQERIWEGVVSENPS